MLHEPSNAESYEAVQSALRGGPVSLSPSVSKMLWFMLESERGCDAEVTPRSFTVWYGTRGASQYFLSVAAGIVSFLLDGVALPETRHVIRRIGPTTVPPFPPFPSWAFGVRHVRIDAIADRTMIRVRTSEAPLADLGSEVPIEGRHQFLALDRACPHCGRTPDRYRVLSDGSHVCLACGRSVPSAVATATS